MPEIARHLKAEHIFWNRVYEPAQVARDTEIKSALKNSGVTVESFNASLLFEPWEIKTAKAHLSKWFTPFSRACLAAPPPPNPLPAPPKQNVIMHDLVDDDLDLLPTKPNWAAAFKWDIGEAAATQKLHGFIEKALGNYAEGRDRPDKEFTSKLSPHLHFGRLARARFLYRAAGANYGESHRQRR